MVIKQWPVIILDTDEITGAKYATRNFFTHNTHEIRKLYNRLTDIVA